MNLLLDTHIAIWALTEPARLGPKGLAAIEDAAEIYVSAVSIWEIAIKNTHGPARGAMPFSAAQAVSEFAASRFLDLPVRAQHAVYVETLPPLHRDPFDRLLIAQAKAEGLRLLSADHVVLAYGHPVLAL